MSQTKIVAAPTQMRREDAEILHSLGLLSADMSAFDAFMLAGKVTGDQFILKGSVWNADGTFRPEQLTTLELLAEMTDAQKLALRERVLGHASNC
jgi:hypothetical protein